MLNLIRRAATVLGAVAAVILLGATAASADCHGNGVNSGNGYKFVGAPGSQQTMTWSLPDRSTYVRSETGAAMSLSICLEARSDWMTQSGHYDARAARNCDDGSSVAGTWKEPSSWGGRAVTGLQKAAGCKYVQTADPSYADCDYVEESVGGCPFQSGAARAWTASSHAMFLRRQNGQLESNNGGDVNAADR